MLAFLMGTNFSCSTFQPSSPLTGKHLKMSHVGDLEEVPGFGKAQIWSLWPSGEGPSGYRDTDLSVSVTLFQINKYKFLKSCLISMYLWIA